MKISLRRCEFLSEEYFVNLLNGRNWLAASRKRITGVYVGKSRGEGGACGFRSTYLAVVSRAGDVAFSIDTG